MSESLQKIHRNLLEIALQGFSAYQQVNEEADIDNEQIWKMIIHQNLLKRGAKKIPNWTKSRSPSADEESLPTASSEVNINLRYWMKHKQWTLCHEIFNLLYTSKKILHPVILPYVLSCFKSRPDAWPALISVAGKRALWLSKFQKDWAWWNIILDITEQSCLTDDFLLETYYRMRQINPAEANRALRTKWPTLPIALKRFCFEAILQNPVECDMQYIREFVHSRRKKDRVHAVSALLQIKNSDEHQSLEKYSRSFLNKTLKYTDQRITFIKVHPSFTGLAFSLDVLSENPYRFKNPGYQLLAMIDPPIWLEKWKGSLELYIDLMVKQAPIELVNALAISSARFQHQKLIRAFLDHWLVNISIETLSTINFQPVFKTLPLPDYNQALREILEKKDDHLLEKLALLGQENPHYISRENSDAVVLLLLNKVRSDISYSDKRYLTAWMATLSVRLDPRCFLLLNKHWPDDHFFYPSLIKPLTKLKSTLEKRFRSFQLIIQN
jgi:hypothetical protein